MPKTLETISNRFNSLNLHDSELLNIQILRSKDGLTNDVCFEIKLLTNPQHGNYKWENAKLIMKDCTVIKIDLDLDGKRACADAIAGASCEIASDLKGYVDKEGLYREKKPLSGYLHFTIGLIHPGGEINVFAKNFELEREI